MQPTYSILVDYRFLSPCHNPDSRSDNPEEFKNKILIVYNVIFGLIIYSDI